METTSPASSPSLNPIRKLGKAVLHMEVLRGLQRAAGWWGGPVARARAAKDGPDRPESAPLP
ncbi:hypothetical protein GCM10009760_64110 [Kitasatospora kazusensis]|uniref:Uncharacterized protein n=1 Tax=Kitasatospora kazusensis TaxID=407974 RepID=A0ABN1ZN49_9ACTN